MARLGDDDTRAARAASRRCGPCSVCCTVLRVDAIRKPAGRDCRHQRGTAGCAIHAERPDVCRGYACLWLQGGLEDDERPDRTGGVVDLEARGTSVVLRVQETEVGAYDASPALQAIAARYREQMPVRVIGPADVDDPDRAFRVLLAEGVEQRVTGEWVETWRDGRRTERRRQPWAERWARRFEVWRRRRALARLDAGDAVPPGRDA